MSDTTSVPVAAKRLGISRNTAYTSAARDGHLAGVPVIRVGKRLLLPTRMLDEVLGLTSPDK